MVLQKARDTMEPLELLDLSKSKTVGQIVDAMSRCSFGARMLGEVAATLTQWVKEGTQPYCVYDGPRDSPVGELIRTMVERGWFAGIAHPEQIGQWCGIGNRPLVVVGGFSERRAPSLFAHPSRAIYINQFQLAKPGQVKDGYYPDAVFADPNFVLPVLFFTLRERLGSPSVPVAELLSALEQYEGVGAEVAHGAETFRLMVEDPDITVLMTLSGAMTIAKMGLVVCDMIDHRMVQYVASTGALMAHGLVEGIGLKHYKHRPDLDDALLAREMLNRVTDTWEPEENLDQVATVITEVLNGFSGDSPISPSMLHRRIGEYLVQHHPNDRGILKSAFQLGIPVCVPAFVDSEIGNDVFVTNIQRVRDGRPRIVMDCELDSHVLVNLVTGAKKVAVFSIGGGVPGNNTNNVAPLIEIANDRVGAGYPPRVYSMGCRICPDPSHLGSYGGCTFQENMSWRKMDPNGRFSRVYADATQVWPFFVRNVLDGRGL